MAVNSRENMRQKIKEFFVQNYEDRKYEERGGDDRVPTKFRGDPKKEARIYAAVVGEQDPYPHLGELDPQELAEWRKRYAQETDIVPINSDSSGDVSESA